MTVGPYEPLALRTPSARADRARAASVEAEDTGVAPESLWLVREEGLIWGIGADERPSGAATLMADLARTVGFAVERRAGLAEALLAGEVSYDEALLVSDEHGIVPASGRAQPRAERFAEGYAKLLSSMGRRR